jgi:hypothetical protein
MHHKASVQRFGNYYARDHNVHQIFLQIRLHLSPVYKHFCYTKLMVIHEDCFHCFVRSNLPFRMYHIF